MKIITIFEISKDHYDIQYHLMEDFEDFLGEFYDELVEFFYDLRDPVKKVLEESL